MGECGDPDLGAPNLNCVGGGPGRGINGQPEGRDPKCELLGNAFIIQEPGQECPDNDANGGMIVFEFEPMVEYVKSIGLLDINEASLVKITFMNKMGEIDDTIVAVPILGDNSYQLLPLDVDEFTGPVKKVQFVTTRCAAVSSIGFCYPKSLGPAPTTGSFPLLPTMVLPTPLSPILGPPTPVPPTPEPLTGNVCIRVDFSTAANGEPLLGGAYVHDEWDAYGLKLFTSGGFGYLPHLFNTSSVGNDLDLGSPNEKCTPSGPGKGEGGHPERDGQNCEYLGNVLIVQNSDKSITIPDDNGGGGSIPFEFDKPVIFQSMGLLDVEYATLISINMES